MNNKKKKQCAISLKIQNHLCQQLYHPQNKKVKKPSDIVVRVTNNNTFFSLSYQQQRTFHFILNLHQRGFFSLTTKIGIKRKSNHFKVQISHKILWKTMNMLNHLFSFFADESLNLVTALLMLNTIITLRRVKNI